MKIILIILAILAVAFFSVNTTSEHHAAKSPLPPRYVVNTEQEARWLAWPQPFAVSGTGSMKPYIPASRHPGEIVAVAAVERPPYEYLKKGDLVIYRWNNKLVIHQIVARQGESWITSGLNNSYYDGPRVNRETFQSRVVRVYIIAPTTNGVADNAR